MSTTAASASLREVRDRRGWGDATTLLTIYLALVFLIPSGYSIGPLGGVGSPAQIFGMLLFIWWVVFRLSRPQSLKVLLQPPRLFMGAFVLTVLISYAINMSKPMSTLELNAADRGVIAVISWFGVFITALEGITTTDRLEAIVRRMAYFGAFEAVLGLAQFVTGEPLIDKIQIPGLAQTSTVGSLLSSGSLNRPAGTALHPIEYGVVLAALLPMALHLALECTDRNPVVRWIPLITISAAIPISISRSAILGVVVVLLVMLPAWTGARRIKALIFMVAGLIVMAGITPSVLGRLQDLFSSLLSGTDSSVQSRTDSYEIAQEFITRNPIFGRGLGTFLPEYRILDNQYLLLTIELGFVGLVVLLCLYFSGMVTAFRARQLADDARTKHLATAILASVGVFTLTFAFFDAFSFPIMTGLVFLVVGLGGGLRRILWEQRGGLPPGGGTTAGDAPTADPEMELEPAGTGLSAG